MIFLCCGCTENTEWTDPDCVGCFNVGAAERGSGFKAILLLDGDTAWCCPSCFVKGQKLAVELVKLVGDKDFHFPSFLPKEENAQSSEKGS